MNASVWNSARRAGALVLAVVACLMVGWTAGVRGGGLGQPGSNVHDLSATGPGTVRATNAAESQVCIFCHTPHNAASAQELWNHAATPANYTVYGSTTLNAAEIVLQPSGASRLCLSCHDGTIAIGATRTHGTVSLSGTAAGGLLPVGASNLGGGGATPNLSDDHPVSFAPVPGPENVLPPAGDAVKLDAAGLLQCTSCHDPHSDSRDPNPGGQRDFLVKSNQASAMCRTCHQKAFWSSVPAVHGTSTRTWNGLGTNPFHTGYTTVADNGCESCHRAHSAPGAMRLLKGQDPNNAVRKGEEWACAPCHNGNVASLNVVSEFSKPYVHPTFATTPSAHEATESPTNGTFTLPETNPATPRHAECADCHNSHAARNAAASPPAAAGSLRQVSGVSAAGTWLTAIGNEYELCFKCHSSSANKPQSNGLPYGPYTSRVIGQFDTRADFQASNPSFHPVLGARNSAEVPSLLTPYTAASVIRCTDCHSNDTGTNAGGAGPRGPHGSNYKRLLERRFDLTDGSTESAQAYALCYKCHDRASVIANRSFTEHNLHIVGINASCTTCHDPHGISALAGGNVTNNGHLINFNKAEVTAVGGVANTPRYEDTGAYHGRCYLTCHNKIHNPLTY